MKTGQATTAEINRALYCKVGRQRQDPEMQLVRSILDYLGLYGVMAFRRNVGAGEYINAEGKRRLVRYNEIGAADIWGVIRNGKHFEIEVKAPGKTPTPEQLAWLAAWKAYGQIAFWCDSFESFEQQWEEESSG